MSAGDERRKKRIHECVSATCAICCFSKCVHLNTCILSPVLQVRWSHTCGSCRSHWWHTSCTTTGSRPPSVYLLGMTSEFGISSIFLFRHHVFCVSFRSIQDQDRRLQALHSACEKLPPANNNNFKWVTVWWIISCQLWWIKTFWLKLLHQLCSGTRQDVSRWMMLKFSEDCWRLTEVL